MFSAIKVAFSGVLSKVVLILLLSLGAFCGYQYWQNDKLTDSLDKTKNDLTALTTAHNTLKDQYGDLEKQLKQKSESDKTTDKIQDETTKTEIVYRDRFDLVDQRVDARVREIRKKYADQEQTAATKVAEDAEVSIARIDGLWSSFCANDSKHPQCQSN